MKIYRVGGAVRDQLLGKKPKEHDWVVVGATPKEMTKKGFKLVGKDFPVFIHPKTGEEYALARTERKIAKGYKGFKISCAPKVTLEEDLRRRDLTINAIAQTKDGKLIDPFNGKKDLKAKKLRHISDAFIEDPVRILRTARFAAKLDRFTVASETNKLMKKMVKNGEVKALVPERVWQELEKALKENAPIRFFEVLNDCGALKIIFPEIAALQGVPNPKKWHPEIDSLAHTFLALKKSAKLTRDPTIRFAVLLHDVGKAKTPKTKWPKHHGHEKTGIKVVKTFCQRFRVPKEYKDLAVLVAGQHDILKIHQFGTEAILRLLNKVDAFRRPKRFEKFLLACQADVQGRKGFENDPFEQGDYLKKLFRAAAKVKIPDKIKNLSNQQIGKKIFELRKNAIQKLIDKH